MVLLNYDHNKWDEIVVPPVNTLQIFITDRCNMRCKGCFYKRRLGNSDMSLKEFKQIVESYSDQVKKVIILGGEPTMNPDLPDMINHVINLGLKITVYTNGYNLKILNGIDPHKISVRLSVYGVDSMEKSILNLPKTGENIMIVYMLRKNNVADLAKAAEIAETSLGCKKFFISSIRDIAMSGSYWKDTEETLPLNDFATVVQDFINTYNGSMEIHISRRGVLETGQSAAIKTDFCRFGNIMTNSDKILCPFDICKELTIPQLTFGQRKCTKHKECLLRKIVLKRK